MKYMLMLIYLFFFSSCYPGYSSHSPKFKKIDPIAKKKAYEITATVSKTLCKRHNMKQVGFGAGMMGSINKLDLTFEILGPISKDELRQIILDCLDEYYTAVNDTKELRNDLSQYPFPKKDLGITIIVEDKDGADFLSHPHICYVYSVNESLIYRSKKTTNKSEVVAKESYAEALKIVKEQKRAAVANRKKLTDEELKKGEKHINSFFYEFAK